MIDYEIGEIRMIIKLSALTADFDGSYTFYYDETNNIKKFYVRESDFNYTFTANFILGGLVHEGETPNLQSLFDSFRLQPNVNEVKFKHIANGDFLDCLKSNRLNQFFRYVNNSNLYIHYSSLNILYWSIVDIVDSAIANSDAAVKLGFPYANRLKNDLYKLCKLEINSVINLFYKYEYPNIKSEFVLKFIEELTSLFDDYIDTLEFHFGLESLRQILKEAKKKGSLPFVMNEEDYVLLKNLTHFYLHPIYTFKNSNHIFDNEESIEDSLNGYRILDNGNEIKNYTFVDSKTSLLIQASDIFVGIMGKLTNYINTSSKDKINNDFNSFTSIQQSNIDLLINLIDRSERKNVGFLQSTDSYEEASKMIYIRMIRKKNNLNE